LWRKDLRQGRRAKFVVSPYVATTYGDPKGGVAKCCAKCYSVWQNATVPLIASQTEKIVNP
jgi:hypothetical protein